MELVSIVVVLALIEYFVFGGLVGRARGKYDIKARGFLLARGQLGGGGGFRESSLGHQHLLGGQQLVHRNANFGCQFQGLVGNAKLGGLALVRGPRRDDRDGDQIQQVHG